MSWETGYTTSEGVVLEWTHPDRAWRVMWHFDGGWGLAKGNYWYGSANGQKPPILYDAVEAAQAQADLLHITAAVAQLTTPTVSA